MRSCNVPGERRATVGPWNWRADQGAFANDECAIGGGFGVNAGTLPAGLVPGVNLRSPGGVAIRRVRLWLTARLRGAGSSMTVQVTSGTSTSTLPGTVLFAAPGGDTLGSPFVSPLLAGDTSYYDVFAACSGDAGPTCAPDETKILDVRGTEVTLEETTPPAGSIDGGALMAGGPQSGVRALAYSAIDHESGIARVSALIGSTVVGVADFLPECPFENFAACQQGRNSAVFADTRKVQNGFHPVSLRVTDAAGNEQTLQSPTVVQVVNAAQVPSLTTIPGSGSGSDGGSGSGGGLSSGGARLIASFASNRRSTLTVGYGGRVVVRGRVLAEDGVPVSGGRVDLQETPQSGNAGRASRELTTGQDGVFAYTVPRGPSRTLTFRYGETAADATPAVHRLKLRVRAAARLRVTLNGVRVHYDGNVLSKPLPRRGKRVEIQGRAPGAAWKTFAVRRTTRRGRFSGTYRLRIHRPGVQLQFRVRVPTEARYPFLAYVGRAENRIVR